MSLGTYLSIAGLVLTIFGLVQSSRAAKAPAPLLQEGEPVLLLGDSIGVGLEAPLRAALLPRGHHLYASVERGRSITAQAAHGLPAMDPIAEVALLSLGSNDPNPDSEESALQSLKAKLEGLGMRVYWIVPPVFAKGTPAQLRAENLFVRTGIPPIETATLPSVNSDPLGVHPTPAGYADYAAQIAAVLLGEKP